jgi:hypothetical protein
VIWEVEREIDEEDEEREVVGVGSELCSDFPSFD